MIGQRLKMLRERAGWTQVELGQKVGVTSNAVSNWERGATEPDIKTILALADLFSVTTDYLLSRTDDRTAYTPVPESWRPLIREATEKGIRPRQLHLAMLLIEDFQDRLAGVPEDPVPPEWRQWVHELIDAGLNLGVARQVIKSVTAYEEAMKTRDKGRG